MFSRLILAICALGLCLAGGGCGDDDITPLIDAGMVDSDVGGNRLTVLVFETMRGVAMPISGATVALDPVGAARLEQTTGVDGKTTFVGVELSAGAAVTASAGADRAIKSTAFLGAQLPELEAVGLANAAGEVTLELTLLAPPETLTLSGIATGLADNGHLFQVSALLPGAAPPPERAGPGWSLPIPRTTEPFQILGCEYMRFPGTTSPRGSELTVFAWLLQNQTAVDGDTTIDIDMSTAAETPVPYSGSFPVPSGAFFDEARASMTIRVAPALGSAIIGHTRRIDINADGTAFDYEGEAITVAGATDLYAQYILADTPKFSAAYLRGDPRTAAQDPAFLEPPEPTSPAFGVDHPLHAPITWTSRDANAMFNISLVRGSGASALTVWRLSVPTGARQASFPNLPSTVDAAMLFSDTVDGRIIACDYDVAERRCLRSATARSFTLTP